MEGPPLGLGGEDITWPDQVPPWGRKASSIRKIKPQTSNLRLELVVGQGVELVGMKQTDLKGCRGTIEAIREGKAKVILVGGVRRVRVDSRK